jgi:hypothetical protein
MAEVQRSRSKSDEWLTEGSGQRGEFYEYDVTELVLGFV